MKNTCDQAINGFVGVFLQRLIQKAAAFSTYVLAEKNEFEDVFIGVRVIKNMAGLVWAFAKIPHIEFPA